MKKAMFLFSLLSFLTLPYGCESHQNEDFEAQKQEDSAREPQHTEFPNKGGRAN